MIKPEIRFIAFCASLLLFSGFGRKAYAGDPPPADPPPPNPTIVDDSSEAVSEIVMMVGSGAGDRIAEQARLQEVFNQTLNTGIGITVLTPDKDLLPENLKNKNRVRVVELSSNNRPEVFGNGFPRDNLPFPITTMKEGKTEYKYLYDEPNLGSGMLDALIKAGQITKKDVIITPFHFDGGDLTTINGNLFVTDDFYNRNQEKKGLTEEEVNQFLTDYLGVEAANIIKLTKPPSEGTGHSDVLVRPLPNGKVVVSVPGSDDMKQEDKDALNSNLATVKNKFGAENVIEIPTEGENPAGSYANAVITKTTVLVPRIGDEEADKKAIDTYKEALPDYKVKQMDSFDQCDKGGGPHCRIGNLTLLSARQQGAGADESPSISYNANTGKLTMTTEELSLLTGSNTMLQDTTDPRWLNDPLLTNEVFLELTELTYQPIRNDLNLASFEGGTVKLISNGDSLFEAELPSLLIWKDINEGFLDIFGILEDVEVNNIVNSPFLDDMIFNLNQSELFLDFYMLSEINLFDLSDDFNNSFNVELSGAGISFNGPVQTSVPEPTSILSLLALGTLGSASILKRKLNPTKSTKKELEKV